MILVHPFFEERVYLQSFKMYLQVECTCLPLVNTNMFDNLLARVGIFEGRNLTRFLKIYNEEMLKRGVNEAAKFNSFSPVIVIRLQERIQEQGTSYMGDCRKSITE